MKNYAKQVGIVLFTLLSFSVNAQSEAETLEWLNVKEAEISLPSSSSTTVEKYKGSTSLSINSDQIKLFNDLGYSTWLPWNSIKEIKEIKYDNLLEILTDKHDGQQYFIRLYIMDDQTRSKYKKALEYMATMKGAKLIKEDLFGS